MKNLLLWAFLIINVQVFAQNPFEKEIVSYEKKDSVAMPPKGQILFLGSSSFRLWKSFDADMAGIPAFNRGFGGSTLKDALYYFDRMVVKYKPSWVFLYEGDNDLAKGQSPEEIRDEFVDFTNRLHKALPKTKLVFVAARPSIARTNILEKQRKLNSLIEEVVKTDKKLFYLDMHYPFFLAEGTLMQDIFVADKLHLNEKGYAIFAEQIKSFIQKNSVK